MSPPDFHLRPVDERDQDFIAALYRSTREDLLGLPMDPIFIDNLIRSQQQIHALGVQQHYPNAQTNVLEYQGQLLGRMVFERNTTGDIRLIDIAVLPSAQRQGLARYMLQYLQQLADTHQASLSLRVFKNNLKARRLYLSAGFQLVDEDEVSEQMCWRAGVAA
ncbi:GNAT family N-acetyltransferase [Methylobacter sp.]|uniref:GNAT family N-acetyltransferase n=1 Tax=Methylobacter sp. TaxID=2051955 RepID=UPI00122576BC|nr:GNAT family N-acetyltransferase [Methylobacter sp.]TAK60161.1 MAG: GNAT family N-acetyltransferase [Methylobacter sp.]